MAVVINNLKKALPQTGLSKADIFYEVLAEAGITRILAILQQFDFEKIGPIRSMRDYFLNFVFDTNSILVHHGGSPNGYSQIKKNQVDNLDGMRLEGSAFFRDVARIRQKGLEHSSYTSGEKIFQAISNHNYIKHLDENFDFMFNFFEDDYTYTGNVSNKVTIPYSNYQISTFSYDENEKLYNRFQNGEKHIDEETNSQLKVKNIIIQFSDTYIVDSEGRRDIKLIGTGTGYLLTNGTYTKINWQKDSLESKTKWYDENMETLLINKGKTWICVVPKNLEISFE